MITDCDKRVQGVTVPKMIDSLPVVAIDRKAFLGCRLMRYVHIPETVTIIDDWAFASCPLLEEVVLPKRDIKFGRGIFDKDLCLERIYTADNDTLMDEASAVLLAYGVRYFSAEHLLDMLEVGSESWYLKWDLSMLHMLKLPDDDGYRHFALSGEEDIFADYDAIYREFCTAKQLSKAEICYIRLLHPKYLDCDNRCYLENHLRAAGYKPNSPGTIRRYDNDKKFASDAAWRLVLDLHGEDERYYELMVRLNMINEDNLECVLEDMGDKHPQMKAYIIKAFEKNEGPGYFDNLLL